MASRNVASFVSRATLVAAMAVAGAAATLRVGAGKAANVAADGPATTTPAPAGVVLRDYGRIGDLVRRIASNKSEGLQWFSNLSDAEQDRVVADLNTWSFHLADTVEPKSLAPDGTALAWRF